MNEHILKTMKLVKFSDDIHFKRLKKKIDYAIIVIKANYLDAKEYFFIFDILHR